MQTSPGAGLVEALPRDGISVASDVAIIVMAVAVVVLAFFMSMLLLRLSRTVAEVRLGVRQNLGPVSDRARAISDNVEFITQALRADVERLNASVKSLTDRLQLASDRMEERIEEFNALMEVVQGEAEDIFIDTASTVRGVRAGARAIALGGRARPSDAADSIPHDETLEGDEAEALTADEV